MDVPETAPSSLREDGVCPVSYDLWDEDIIANVNEYSRLLRKQGPVLFNSRINAYVVTRYDECHQVLTNPAMFTSTDGQGLAHARTAPPELRAAKKRGYGFPKTLVTADPPIHTEFRHMMNKHFTPRRMAEMDEHIQAIASELIDGFASTGSCDLVRDFAAPFSMTVMADWLGQPRSMLPQLQRWAEATMHPVGRNLTREELVSCAQSINEFQAYFAGQFEARRSNPRSDLLTELLNERLSDGRRLTIDELLSIVQLLVVGGSETTANQIGNTMKTLIEQPGLIQQVLQGAPQSIAGLVEEGLRFESSAAVLFRTATQDVELNGVTIRKGYKVMLLLGSANHDESVFSHSDTFDFERSNAKRHISFGHGPHVCLGAPLARLELRIALQMLLTRLVDLRLADDNLVHHPDFYIRGLQRLPVTFRAAS